MNTALITGVTGQDGSYLAELLLSKGYRVVGMSRGRLDESYQQIRGSVSQIEMASGSLLDEDSLIQLLENIRPTEIYNLAAHSFLPDHRSQPVVTAEIAALGVTRMLEAIRLTNPRIKFFQASSSEMFGNPVEMPQTERTSFQPRNLYAIAKVYAHSVGAYYRETHGMHVCCGILYNHESPRRNVNFVTRKVTQEAVKIKLGLSTSLTLGNLDSRRDWGYAGDYVEGMWLMMQKSHPDDYILASGETFSIRDLCEYAFTYLGLNYQDYVIQDPRFMRSTESIARVGDPSKAENELGWIRKVKFKELIEMMVDSDLQNFDQMN